MKYCEKCGTQIPNDIVACPQCYPQQTTNITSTNSSQEHSQKKFDKITILIVTNIILTIAVLIVSIMHLTNNSTGNINDFNSDSVCPASEYGYHDWSKATCQEPSHCYNCRLEKNSELGNHDWYVEDDGKRYCWNCGIPYTE